MAKKVKKPILSSNLFPVVGIGASAGGLDAFKKLLKAIPPHSGMAYVLVQHLDPTHQSLLPDLLQKITPIPVIEISDDIQVKPDHIYIIPSNKMLVANDGVLELSPRPAKSNREPNLPIDLFFTSLAAVHQAHAIGVVLSGTASDGTLGLKAIKEHGGLTFAQDQDSAIYNSMPLSAVQAGVVDHVLPPEEIPLKIIELLDQVSTEGPAQHDTIISKILLLLRNHKGTDFTFYKQSTIQRRVTLRMQLNGLETYADYLSFLEEHPAELGNLYQSLLIPVTSFFRDEKTFELLCKDVLPEILKDKPSAEPIRVWVAGCSTGQEVYSIAICIKEFLGDNSVKVQVFATDISEPAIVKARAGTYTADEVKGLSPERLNLFFNSLNGNYQISKEIREFCVFAHHDFLHDPPFGRMDVISCRNVLIYLEPYLQQKALAAFHYALNEKGFLLLGNAESVKNATDIFSVYDSAGKIFIRKNINGKLTLPQGKRTYPAGKTEVIPVPEVRPHSFQKSTDEMLLSRFTPAAVVVNDAMDIVYFRGNTGLYLQPSEGKPSHNLSRMARTGLAFELRSILHKARKTNKPVIKDKIPLLESGVHRHVSIEAIPMANMPEPYYLVLFHDTVPGVEIKPGTRKTKLSAQANQEDYVLRIRKLEQELVQTREDMRAITEHQEEANTELQGANEELQSTGEELQSLNDELETSKEELQNTNEELQVLNQALAATSHVAELARDFAEAIIATVRTPLLVLDKDLRMRTANQAFYSLFGLSASDTKGKLVYNLGGREWNSHELQSLLELILPEKKNLVDYQVSSAFPFIGERTMLLNARQLVDHEEEKLILLSIEDITEKKKAQEILTSNTNRLQQLVKELPAGVYACDAKGRITFYNQAAVDLWGREPELGKEHWCGSWKLYTADGTPLPLDKCPMAVAVKEGRAIMGEELIVERVGGTRSHVLVYPQPEFSLSGEITGAINMVFDITSQVIANKQTKESEERFRYLVEQTLSPICIFKGEDMILEVANESVFRIWNVKSNVLGKPFLEIVPEMRDQPFMHLLTEVYRTGITHHGSEWPAYFIREDGVKEDLYFNFVFQPYREHNGTISGVFVFANDVTDQVKAKNKNLEDQESRNKELEEKVQQRTVELSEANEELQKKNKELESFTHISSHDLQEPLRKIQTFTNKILDSEEEHLSEKGKEYFTRIRQASGRMQTLLEDLLMYSRTSTSDRVFEDIDLNSVVEEAVNELAEVIKEKNAIIRIGELCPAKINAFQFRQVMINLVGNALKFTRPTIVPHITINSMILEGKRLAEENTALAPDRLLPWQKYCHIRITDNGIGFEPKYNEQIFEVFERLYGKDEYPGTGIGLAIVRKIITNHDGFIFATGEVNKGASFDIYIPHER